MTEKKSVLSLSLRSFLYAILSVALELTALFVVLFYIDETPIEGSPEGLMLVIAALLIAAAFIFFVLHRIFFGRLRELNTGLRAHWSRAWAGYILLLLGIVAANIGITDSGAITRPERTWLEAAWNGPASLALLPVLADVLRVVSTRLFTMVARWKTNRKRVLFLVVLFAIALVLAIYQYARFSTPSIFTPTRVSTSYVEYPFDSGKDIDLGFTKRAYEKLSNQRGLPDEGSAALDDGSMTHVRLSREDLGGGVVERRIWGDDLYELRQTYLDRLFDNYRMFVNDRELFKEHMALAAQGPVLDWRVIDGKSAFTFTVSCSPDDKNRITCDRDVWYDGNLISREFGVKDPRYVFSYDGMVGFVASDNGMDRVYFDGRFITPGFDTIWTHNCCSYTEILPTVFENGALLFYAIRDGNDMLAEVRLE